jgi:type I restriction enzyme S subunit
MTKLKEYKLSDVADFIDYRGKTPKKISSGVPLITAKIVKNGWIQKPNEFISKDDYLTWMTRGFPKVGDVVLTTEAPLGEVAQIKDASFALAQRIITIRGKDNLIENGYLKYFLQSSIGQHRLKERETGTTVTGIKSSELRQVLISAPDFQTQTSIAEILSSLDDKIELNNKINQELETLAQTLFKQWFIDFEFPNENGEPYKSSGGEMVDSELGEIPKGWRVYSMDELLETVSKTYPLKKVNEVVFLNTGDIQDGKFLHKNFSNPKNLPGQAKKSISQNDILYSEIRPANKRFAYVYFDSSQYVVSTKLMVLRSIVEMNSLFQYFYLTQQESIKHLQHLAESRSGTFPQITFSEVSTVKIALPDFDLVNTFVEIALKPYYDNQFQIKEENESLVRLRDTLLPKLISGELEINENNN